MARLKQASLVSKDDINNFVNNTDFDNKLLSFNKRVNSDKTKHLRVEKELSELSKKVEAISTIVLRKDSINGYKVLNGATYFSSGILQNYLVSFSNKKSFAFFTTNTSNIFRIIATIFILTMSLFYKIIKQN